MKQVAEKEIFVLEKRQFAAWDVDVIVFGTQSAVLINGNRSRLRFVEDFLHNMAMLRPVLVPNDDFRGASRRQRRVNGENRSRRDDEQREQEKYQELATECAQDD